MSSSTSSSRLFLASLAAGLVLAGAAFSVMDESYLHTGPEFGMAAAVEDKIVSACARKAAPELLIVGDSRAVAGISAVTLTAEGVDAEKFALGASGIFAGWATLDRLIDCGVRPREVVMAYGVIHLINTGAVMERTTNYDSIRGPRASHAYARLAQWEERPLRAAAYRAVALLGPELALLDIVLLRPSLRNVLEAPPRMAENRAIFSHERRAFTDNLGDRFYGVTGLDAYPSPLPEESGHFTGVSAVNLHAAEAIAALGRAHDIPVRLYVLPMSEAAMAGVSPHIYEMAEDVIQRLEGFGVRPMNGVWSLPDADFGDPSHVNETGRRKTTADFLKRYRSQGVSSAGAGEMHDAEALAP